MMQTGTLTERIVIQRKEGGFDPIGQPLPEDWVDWIEAWASIRHLSGLETIKAAALTSTVKASIRLRYRPGINASMRIRHGDTLYEIEAVMPGRHRYNKYIDLICTTMGNAS